MDYDRIQASMLAMIEEAERREPPLAKSALPGHIFALTFQTVAINPGRRTGKTEFIQRCLQSDANAIAVVPLSSWRSQVYRYRRNVFTPNELSNLRGRRLSRVFIDEPSAVFKAMSWHKVHDALWTTRPSLYVLLGE
jgi:hypothetical protein